MHWAGPGQGHWQLLGSPGLSRCEETRKWTPRLLVDRVDVFSSAGINQLPKVKLNIKSFIHFLQYSERSGRAQSCPVIVSRRVFSVDTDMTTDSGVLCPCLMLHSGEIWPWSQAAPWAQGGITQSVMDAQICWPNYPANTAPIGRLLPSLGGEIDYFGSRGPGPASHRQILHHRHPSRLISKIIFCSSQR